ncbi:hypothetical protein B5S50_11825 [Clostridium sp. 001]|uniref:Uncharacterized protein n=2 Tax=Clostridium TaxID=1485 RepID=A0A1A6AP24_9CLOT|nr:hypothetical protein CLRAG_27720 [Clostridium ragsdalei P11]QXE19453.1 hypothetical protein B5S50_11825 [Clostridium sp. 001]
MRIVHLFDKYFFILMVIEGIILTFIESKKFKRNRLIKTAFKSRVIGVILIVLSVVLYAFSIYSF